MSDLGTCPVFGYECEYVSMVEAQAAEIEYWKAEARSVRKELKSEQKSADNAMDNYDAGVRRIEAQAGEIEALHDRIEKLLRNVEGHIDDKAAQATEIDWLRAVLELADAALRGANVNMNVLERKIAKALAGKAE
jgi:chromosome segregation ATPase